MDNTFEKVKNYLTELGCQITDEQETDGMLVVEKEREGVKNLVIQLADPILIMEQFLFELKHPSEQIFRELLVKNRDVIHGAFALDEGGTKVIYRDTLQLENLDLNELEGSINALSMLLSEYSDEIIQFSKAH